MVNVKLLKQFFYLCLPIGFEIVLNNFYYAPSITRGVISVFRLYKDGFVNRFVDNTIQVSRNDVVYFSAISRDGIFEINLSNSLTNESSIYAVSNKSAKLYLDSALLWHCRLGNISKKRIEKLQHDGLLNSSDLRAFEKYVSYVCGPFKIMSRQGASYFITFTDDFSRYGYVYLLKHKHEVFETFKVFQKEVENQLGKTIKSLRSDRRGEYMSQKFLDHLKDHEIIAHRTPPYTSQHNGVSERRNRTILDMVRSMMSQTTLPKSFWDYALETAARILNMVPTKKVEKTPYEVWHGKAPKLSYLKVWENSLIDQEASGSLEDLEIIQEEDTHPSLDISLNHKEDDLEIDEPQSDIVPIRRSTRTRRALDRMCLYIDAEKHKLGDLGEPANYRAALLDPESEKWLNAMNVEMQSMKDNEVWVLVELPPNGKTVGNLGEAAYILGIKIYRDRSKRLIGLCQSAYIEKILKRYCMENSKRRSITMQEKLKLSKSQECNKPILAESRVSCYTDVGYLTYADDLKSQTRYVFILNGGAVDWKSAKQSIFASSSAEDEYIDTFDASKEAVWVRKFISALGVVLIIEEPISMYCDNTGAIAIANESEIMKGARHFCAKVH
nr:hypothetical protein [Tanacetum cinerariifolium]